MLSQVRRKVAGSCAKAFQMQPVLVLPVDQSQIHLRAEPAGIPSVGKDLRQTAFRSAIPVFEARAKLDTIVRYMYDVNTQSVCFVIEQAVGLQLRTHFR